jgi:low temperature requirement protein LtrA
MSLAEAPTGVLRPRARESNQVLPVELFFDLVYVLAITQLTRHLLAHMRLYLLGHNLFKLAVWGHLSSSRLAGLCALGALAPLAVVSSALLLFAAATSVLVGVVAMDLVVERRRLAAESQAVAAAVEA